MNREAAALGVPVYSIFRGKIGAVDRHLVETGRLTLLESPADVETKISVKKRLRETHTKTSNERTLKNVVDNVVRALERSDSKNRLHPFAAQDSRRDNM